MLVWLQNKSRIPKNNISDVAMGAMYLSLASKTKS